MGGQFTLSISKFRADTEQKMRTTVRWICLEITRRVIMKTPVDTGRARGSWTPSIGSIGSDSGAFDKGGVAGVSRANSVLSQYRLGDVFYLTSSLPYMPTLEYGRYPNPPRKGSGTVGGFSKKAPQGMLRITLAEFPGVVAESAAHSKE